MAASRLMCPSPIWFGAWNRTVGSFSRKSFGTSMASKLVCALNAIQGTSEKDYAHATVRTLDFRVQAKNYTRFASSLPHPRLRSSARLARFSRFATTLCLLSE